MILIIIDLFSHSKKHCFKGLCLNSNYSKDDLPILNETNEVQVDFELIEITDISDASHSFSISAVLVVQWFEPRVTYNGSELTLRKNKESIKVKRTLHVLYHFGNGMRIWAWMVGFTKSYASVQKSKCDFCNP